MNAVWIEETCTLPVRLTPRSATTRTDLLENVPIRAGFACFQWMLREEPKKDLAMCRYRVFPSNGPLRENRFPKLVPRSSVHDTDPGRDRYDVMITAEQGVLAGQKNTLLLFPERLGIVLSPTLSARIQLTELDSIFSHPLLHTKTRPNAWTSWSDAIGYQATAPAGVEFEHYYFTLEATIAGLGICVAPWHLVADDIRLGRLLAPFGFHQRNYSYIAKRSPEHNKKLDLFCTWLACQAEQDSSPSA